MKTRLSDIIVSSLPGGPEMVGVLCTIASVQTSLLLRLTIPSGPMHPNWAGARSAMACQPGHPGERRRQKYIHSNCLELKAAILLNAFLRVGMQPSSQSRGHHPPRHILLEMENTTAVAYVNRRGTLRHHLCPYWPCSCGPAC